MVGMIGLAYILQARNFMASNKLHPEDFLANSHQAVFTFTPGFGLSPLIPKPTKKSQLWATL
jgi:hypothetical protein